MNQRRTEHGILGKSQERWSGLSFGDVSEGGLILCVSEDVTVARRDVVPVLEQSGFEVRLVSADMVPLTPSEVGAHSLILLDVNSLDGDGYRFCEQLRTSVEVPLMLILRGAARTDILRGYQAGADSYILFPFDPRELLVRMQALLRRRPGFRPAQ